MHRRTILALLLLLHGPAPAQDAPVDPAAQQIRIHDVRDLVERVSGGVASDARTDAGARELVVADLATAIRTFVEPALREGESITAVGSTHVVVVARAGQQDWVERFLALQRDARETVLVLEIRIYMVPAASYATLGLENGPRVFQGVDGRMVRIAHDDVEEVTVARLAALPMHRASLFAGQQLKYVQDYEFVEIDMEGRKVLIPDPKIATIEDGTWLDGTLSLVGPDTIGLDLRLNLQVVEQPFPVFETKFGVDGTLKIQLPSATSTTLAAVAAVRAGDSIMFPAPAFRGRHPVMIVSPRIGGR
ncbi:MAG: hypothetical protein IPM29_22280 [Planctomycetes bacterium]|nr:hypothetical protein [Planctomycetota bacterium]